MPTTHRRSYAELERELANSAEAMKLSDFAKAEREISDIAYATKNTEKDVASIKKQITYFVTLIITAVLVGVLRLVMVQ